VYGKQYSVNFKNNILKKASLLEMLYNHDYDLNVSNLRNPTECLRSINSFLSVKEHRMIVRSYELTNKDVPLFVQRSGFFYKGIFPKMDSGVDIDKIYNMVVNGNLNVLTEFRERRDMLGIDSYSDVDHYKLIPIIDCCDNVMMLNAFIDGNIIFLEFVKRHYIVSSGGYNIIITMNADELGDGVDTLYTDGHVAALVHTLHNPRFNRCN
jgi:hypothetical protein